MALDVTQHPWAAAGISSSRKLVVTLSNPQVALESQAATQHPQLQTRLGAELPLGANPAQSIPILSPLAWAAAGREVLGATGAVPSPRGGGGTQGSRRRARPDLSRDFGAELARVAPQQPPKAGVFVPGAGSNRVPTCVNSTWLSLATCTMPPQLLSAPCVLPKGAEMVPVSATCQPEEGMVPHCPIPAQSHGARQRPAAPPDP